MSNHPAEQAIHAFLTDQFGEHWTLQPATHGATGSAFLADSGNRRVFVKLVRPIPALTALAEAEISPPILAISEPKSYGKTITVMKYIDGIAADRTWIADHILDIVALLKTVQTAPQIASALGPQPTESLQAHRQRLAMELAEEIHQLPNPAFRLPGLRVVIQEFSTQALPDLPGTLVPTHIDPNNSNWLIAEDGHLYLLDWDGMAWSDPLRDLALVLWWYVPRDDWVQAITMLGQQTADWLKIESRIHWWAAYTSLGVALDISRDHPDSSMIKSFLDDFLAAAHNRPNPKRS